MIIDSYIERSRKTLYERIKAKQMQLEEKEKIEKMMTKPKENDEENP